jgi:hypothetical protein
MEFNDSFWSVKKGLNIYDATETNDIEILDNSITAYVTPLYVHN